MLESLTVNSLYLKGFCFGFCFVSYLLHSTGRQRALCQPRGGGKGWKKTVQPPWKAHRAWGRTRELQTRGWRGQGEKGWGRTERGPGCSELTRSDCVFFQCLPPVQAALGSLSQQNMGLSLGRSPSSDTVPLS